MWLQKLAAFDPVHIYLFIHLHMHCIDIPSYATHFQKGSVKKKLKQNHKVTLSRVQPTI